MAEAACFSEKGSTWVTMGWRPTGALEMRETLRRPERHWCRVRGMGVAERLRQSSVLRSALSLSLSRTPKRCSSSTTSRPRSLKRTSS